MSVSDPISDLLVRLLNAHRAEHEVVEVPHSRMKGEITRILKSEGYITDYVVEGDLKKMLRVYLKYDVEHRPAITGLKRISRPSRRRYVGVGEIPRILGGLGMAVISTSSGLMTGSEAKQRQLGGELLCSVW
ncbi:MAG: 30S ribosomal protein S8 [Lentisphaerae bacterium]|nr:30S ribosomal protein S8 [Lentisphaerota bacterium]